MLGVGELLAEAGDRHVEGIVGDVERVAPHPLGDDGARDDGVGVTEEEFEQGVLLRPEVEEHRAPDPVECDAVARGVERERACPENGVAGGEGRPAAEGAEPGEELFEGERLGEVVVGPGVEPGDAVFEVAEGGEHEDGLVPPLRSQRLDDRFAVAVREPPVDDVGVVGIREGEALALRGVGGVVDGVALLLQPALERGGEPLLVFDDQDPHGRKGGR